MNVDFSLASPADIEVLTAIRTAAMRESLERIGRFDPLRVKARILASFERSTFRFVGYGGVQAGFFAVCLQERLLLLDHLYVRPGYQGNGIGAAVLKAVFAEADASHVPVRVGALRGSRANAFYQRHGFVKVEESESDIYYLREPRQDI